MTPSTASTQIFGSGKPRRRNEETSRYPVGGAIADIQAIAAWLTEEASGAVARRYVGRIKASLAKLAFASERGTVRDEIMDGLRVVGILGSASVAFRVSEDRVTIFRVFHGGQDWQTALTADDGTD